MIVQARQARVANRFAPKQTRRGTAQAWIFGRYTNVLALWLDVYRSQFAVGAITSSVPDASPRRYSISQALSSKCPVTSMKNNVKALQFDGLNDCLTTSVVALGLPTLTCVAMSIQTSGVGIVAEASIDTGSFTNAFVHSRGDGPARNCVGFYKGNVGLQYLQGSAGFVDWVQAAVVCDKTLPAATEMKLYTNNTVAPLFAATRSDNTNTFGDYAWNLGARNNGAVAPLLGFISQIFVFTSALSDFDRTDVYRSTCEICCLGW